MSSKQFEMKYDGYKNQQRIIKITNSHENMNPSDSTEGPSSPASDTSKTDASRKPTSKARSQRTLPRCTYMQPPATDIQRDLYA